MKGVILAGGLGKRLRPLTLTRPKQLLPVANKPVLFHVIEGLVSAGVDDLGVLVSAPHSATIKAHISEATYDVPITVIDQGEPRGLAHAVGCAKSYVDGDPFVVCFGDTLLATEISVTVLTQFDTAESSMFLPLQSVETPSRFGIVEFENGHPTRVHEKPSSPPSTIAYMGLVGFGPTVFDCIDDLEPSSRGELELTDAIDALLKRDDQTQWKLFDGRWIDVGTPEDLLTANRAVLDDLDNNTRTASTAANRESAFVVGSETRIDSAATVVGPVVIGNGVRIDGDSRVGPYLSVGDNCHIENASLQETVLLESVTVSDVELRKSIIGANAVVQSLDTPAQLVLGDDCVVR